MSLFDDYEAEVAFSRDFPFGVPCKHWHSKDGDILVTEMTEAHIRNCMNLVGMDDAWYPYFEQELERRKTHKEPTFCNEWDCPNNHDGNCYVSDDECPSLQQFYENRRKKENSNT